MNCSGLIDISIGNNISTINKEIFNGCTSLKTLTLGGRITQIKDNNFESCKELTTVYCYAENPPSLGNNVFSESYIEYATLYVPTQSIDKYRKHPKWGSFKYIFPIENIYGEKCAKPTISYKNGKLTFKSTTDDARFVTTIKDDDIKSYEGSEVNLHLTYIIEVCAKSYGYLDSDVAIATLCWMDKEPTTEGITDNIANLSAQAVLIQSEGGVLTIQGLDDGQQVRVYSINGTEAGAAVSRNGLAPVGTNLKAGSVVIIKIGDRSVKVAIK